MRRLCHALYNAECSGIWYCKVMFDFTGTRFDFTVAEGMPDRVTLRFSESRTAEMVNLTGSTWQFRAVNAGSAASVAGLSVEHGAGTGELVLLIPVLTAGEYRYELFATDAAGDVNRVLYGVFTAITSEHGAKLVKADYTAVSRTLDVVVPVVYGAKLELRWVSCSVAEAAAATAVGAIDAAQQEADRAKQEADRAAGEADRAEGAADGVRDELYDVIIKADKAVGKVEQMEGRLDAIDSHIRDSIVPNSVTNTWWVAGVDSHYPVTGEAGKSPYVGTRGTWMVWNDALHAYVDTGLDPKGKPGVAPKVGVNGNWLRWNERLEVWEDTGARAIGRDGVDGTAVRRIVVDGVEDIPTEGETCNGGVYYYVPLIDALPVAVIDVLDAAGGGFTVNGSVVSYSAQESRETAAEAVASALRTGLSALPRLDVSTDGSRVVLVADILGWTFEALDAERYAVEEHVRMKPLERYDVYAWLERPDDASGWVCVGEANDLATSEIFGLVKTGTDREVAGGAPVGLNADKQLSVPRADYGTPGSVLPSVAATVESGGCIGFDEEGRMRAQAAEHHRQGSVALSFNGICEVACVGLMEDGTIGLPWATLHQPGVMRLGSVFRQLNRIPYQQGVGCTDDHQLSNNLLYGGAIQHKKLSAWLQHGMEWLAGIPDTPYLNNTDYYLGLVTSAQFSQSEAAGLVLEPATVSKLAGVHLANSMEDTRETAVPLASTVREWSLQAHYTKGETYSRQEIDGKLEEKASLAEMAEYKRIVNNAIASHNQSVALTLGNYDNYIHTQLFTKDEFATAKQVFMTRTENWHGSVVMSENEYNNLKEIDPHKMYFLTSEE